MVLALQNLRAMISSKKHSDPIRISLDRHWMNLHPGLQHTRNGDLVLCNQFDSLVGLDASGDPTPLGALSWEVSENFTKFRFKIDRSKRFSDGTYLSAKHYKRSWEDSAKLIPKSANAGVADVMQDLEGFADFAETGDLRGVRAPDDDFLVISFDRPMRLALNFLSGVRFSAYKFAGEDNYFIGTGHYVIQPLNEDELRLIANPFNSNPAAIPEIAVNYMPLETAEAALLDGRIDVIGYSAGDELGKWEPGQSLIKPVIGSDGLHSVLYLNGLNGRTLADHDLRSALQWFVIEKALVMVAHFGRAEAMGFFNTDAQIYSPSRAGRISDDEAAALIARGERRFAAMVEKSGRHPLRVWTADSTGWLVRALREAGIKLTDDSGIVEPKVRIGAYYKTFEPDVIALNVSVVNSDPDGIYHVLGRHGAVTSPMIQRERVSQLVEQGRPITDTQLINAHYSKVTRAVLDEIPFIHLGFSKSVSLIRADEITIDREIALRNQGHLHIFRRKIAAQTAGG